MSDSEVIGGVCAVALLVSYLIYMQWQRALERAANRRQSHHTGDVIDVVTLRPRVKEVRNYTAAAHAHARGIPAREGRLASARQKLGLLSFFRREHPEIDGQHMA